MTAVWSYLTPRNLLDFQREAALRAMQDECRRLLADGYAVDADRLLDEIAERRRQWQVSEPEWGA
jgi:hypothetical protein